MTGTATDLWENQAQRLLDPSDLLRRIRGMLVTPLPPKLDTVHEGLSGPQPLQRFNLSRPWRSPPLP